MTIAPTIRLLETRDLPELVELCEEHATYERADWIPRDRIGALQSLLIDADNARCWVVEIHSGHEPADGKAKLAGFATANLELSTWDAALYLHLDCLYLREPYRGQGLGRALFAQVAAEVERLGAINLQWQTPDWNVDAIRFYRGLGATSKSKLRFTLDTEGCRALRRE